MISVVIPLYNKEQSIVQTLQSVMAQTYHNYEVVVVNDGSTDKSADVVEQFIMQHKMENVRLISKANGGVSSARNKGIQEAKYEYIAFLDGDDLWEETYLEELAKLITDYPEAGIYSLGYGYIEKGEKIIIPNEYSNYRGIVQNWLNPTIGFWTGTTTTTTKLAITKGGVFDERMAYGEDLDMWWRLALSFPVAYYGKVLAYYQQDAENRAMNKIIPFDKHIPFYIEKYAEYRKNNAAFRKYFDLQMLYRLYPYALENKWNPDLKRVLKQIDFSQQKLTMRLRFWFPKMYNRYMKIKHER